jgi:GT2 family glycosyltransferase
MDVSLILVNYNSKEHLERCLASIKQNNKRHSLEIIVVDNASTDGSQAMVRAAHPEVTLIRNTNNLGFGKANNLGIQLAKGKYLLLLNNDTILNNDAIAALVKCLDNAPKAGIVACKVFEPDGKIQKNCRSFPLSPFDTMFGRASLFSKLFPSNPITKRTTLSDWDYNSPRQVDWVSGACMLIRRKVLDQIGLLDENYFMYWEDTDFCKRAKDAGWEIWFTPEGEIVHYSGQGGGKRPLSLKLYTIYQMHRSAYYYFLKHHYKTPLHPMAVITFLGMITLVTVKSAQAIIKSIFGSVLPKGTK